MKKKETSKKSSSSTRKTKIAAISISVLFAFILLEVMIRVLLFVNPNLISFEEQDRDFLVRNPYWKIWHYPNNEVRHQRACFDVDYQTNSLGMVGDEIDTSKFKIALIGDSYIEGYGANSTSNMPSILDSLVGDNVEIMNFGTSGGFGTVHQYALYENFIKYLEPDVVMLFFLSYNDLYDNVNAISEGFIDNDLNYTFDKTSSLNEVQQMLNDLPEPSIRKSEKGWFVTVNLIQKGLKSIGLSVQYILNTKIEFRGARADVLNPEQNEVLNQGYAIFKKTLNDLKSKVESQGSKFVLVQIPTPYQVDPSWLSMNGKKAGTQLDANVPNQRVNKMAKELNIDVLDLLPSALSYIEQEELSFPYFYHNCNPHMTAEGNKWFAKEVHNYIESQKLIK